MQADQTVARISAAIGREAVVAAFESAREPSTAAHRADPVLRRILRAWIATILRGQLVVTGQEHLSGLTGPLILVSNHLSYVDTTATEHALLRAGATALANRLVAVAGPKVWGKPLHALCTRALNVLPTVQAGSISTSGDQERARRSVAQGRRLLASKQPLLLYPEGSRSRTGRLGPFISGTKHFLPEGVTILPVGLSGTDRLYPIGADRVFRADVKITFGSTFISDGETALTAARACIAELLPEAQQPGAGPPIA